MNNSTNFSGNSVFGQLISLIPKHQVQRAVNKYHSDKFTKRFSTWEHLVSMLFATASNTTSLRDVTNGFLGLEGKLQHLNLKRPPKRSTISDANKRRSYQVFEKIYYDLLTQYQPILSDSRFKNEFGKELSIGRKPESGKRKGGIKVHMQIRPDYNAPVLVKFTDATTHDSSFMNDIEFTNDHIYVFDKGYNDYERFEYFNTHQIPFVTRLKHNAAFRRKKEFELAADSNQSILLDEQIVLPIRENGKINRGLPLRRVVYWDEKHQVCYEFISNIYDLSADQITLIYKSRWQIETLHKQLKQNQSLSYFLGDNVNAIIIQIWCALIWNLLLTVLQRQIKAKVWAFSNLASVIRLHLFNYINLNSFLKNPMKHYQEIVAQELKLFDG
ncbi:MAG: IS4 family transposase [Bacteroidetes bacterium]|nr:IS4 family transposase [Bacteroidota bacterium]